ncbi:dynamin family protein [Pseudaestuariivita rosea]|uniref:dynamin family protein n=1 Tax=Pseudaestuariivita rosea TaxID=2763263 RepID=UPI001ABA7108|nr:dynamin family protein [Pseudaestuariivita rosea]
MTGQAPNKRQLSPAQLERLTKWAKRKPAIALMGEFSAGKSTLLNLLLGTSILPTQVTATQLPPVWMRYGEGEPFRMDVYGNRRSVDLNDIGSINVRKTRFIRVYSKAEFLKRCDLIDTPGISDPNIPAQVWMHAVGYANAILWCTHATQAWRESERSAWVSLPDRLKDKSLLLVTRADKLATPEDRQRVDARLEREAAPLFRSRHFMALLEAIEAREAGDTGPMWEQSGGKGFTEAFDRVLDDIMTERGKMLMRHNGDTSSNVESFPGVVRPNRPGRDNPLVQSFSPVRPSRPARNPEERRERLPTSEANDLRSKLGGDDTLQAAAPASENTEAQQPTPPAAPEPPAENKISALRAAFDGNLRPENSSDADQHIEETVEEPVAETPTASSAAGFGHSFAPMTDEDRAQQDQVAQAKDDTDVDVPHDDFEYRPVETPAEPVSTFAPVFTEETTEDADHSEEPVIDAVSETADEPAQFDESEVFAEVEEYADMTEPLSKQVEEVEEDDIIKDVATNVVGVLGSAQSEPDAKASALQETASVDLPETDDALEDAPTDVLPSQIWAEIAQRGDINSIPDVLAAVQELLERIEAQDEAMMQAEQQAAETDDDPAPGGWSKLA